MSDISIRFAARVVFALVLRKVADIIDPRIIVHSGAGDVPQADRVKPRRHKMKRKS